MRPVLLPGSQMPANLPAPLKPQQAAHRLRHGCAPLASATAPDAVPAALEIPPRRPPAICAFGPRRVGRAVRHTPRQHTAAGHRSPGRPETLGVGTPGRAHRTALQHAGSGQQVGDGSPHVCGADGGRPAQDASASPARVGPFPGSSSRQTCWACDTAARPLRTETRTGTVPRPRFLLVWEPQGLGQVLYVEKGGGPGHRGQDRHPPPHQQTSLHTATFPRGPRLPLTCT